MSEDLKILIKAEGAPEAAAGVKQVDAAVQKVTPSATATAAAVESLQKRMQQFARITSIVAGATAIIATLRKIAEAIDAVTASLKRNTDDIRVGNLVSRVNMLADSYARLTGEIDKSANAQQTATDNQQADIQTGADREQAQIDKDTATAILRHPERRDALTAAGEAQKLAVRSRASSDSEAIALSSNTQALSIAEQRRATAAAATEAALAAVATTGNRHAELDASVKQEAGFSSRDLFSGKFAEDPRYAAAQAKFEPLFKAADEAAARATAAARKAQADEAAAAAEIDKLRTDRVRIEREGTTRRLREETEGINARIAAATEAPPPSTTTADPRRAAEAAAKLAADTAAKLAGITVEAPRSASAYGATGGIMGGQIITADRLRDQRESARDAILREQATLLAQIKERLDE